MKFKIHNSTLNDYFIIEGDSIEECINNAKKETEKRFWKSSDCCSEKI